MTPEEQFAEIRQNLQRVSEAQGSIQSHLDAISANQMRFDNALTTLIEQQANHGSQMREMEKHHNRHMRYLERIMERLSVMFIDHEDRLQHLEKDDETPNDGKEAA